MEIFQKSVIQKYLQTLDENKVNAAYQKYLQFYGNKKRIQNITLLKEENYQEGFLREIFVQVLGYRINPDENYNLTTEFKNLTDAKKADAAILKDNKAIGVIELKSTRTKNLDTIKQQAFNYKNNQPDCKYVITSNFHLLRFYIDNATEFEEFDLFNLTETDFKKFYLILSKQNIFSDIPAKLKQETQFHEEKISDTFYKDYSTFKHKIFNNLVVNNPQYNRLLLFKKSQKLLDRLLFVFFAEDCGLVPPNAISRIIDQWNQLKELEAYQSLYDRFKQFFEHLDKGHNYNTYELPPYNGGLFTTDEILNTVKIDDEVLEKDSLKLSAYDYNTEIDVNILGHIFEHSINEIEEITAELEGTKTDKKKTKRKKEGIYYTPKYITQYIVESTIGALCQEKKTELGISEIGIDESYRKADGNISKKGEQLFKKLTDYKDWLLSLKILDPACGSGAFLNQALDFLIAEHKTNDALINELTNQPLGLFDTDKSILENKLFGVDINDESVEIAKLSLWLRTARKDRKLSMLNENIKCGNSLIDDPNIAGEKAFNWNEEFPEIMENGGFDVVIGNPPYVFAREKISQSEKDFYTICYKSANYQVNTYLLFIERTIDLVKSTGYFGLIVPNAWLMVYSGKGLRKYILDKCNLNQIINLEGYSFEGVNVETIIVIAAKEKLLNNEFSVFLSKGKKFVLSHKRNQNDFSHEDGFEFKVFSDDISSALTKKMKSNSIELDSIVWIKAGLQAYEKGKGNPEQTAEDVKNRPYDYTFKFDENTFKYLEGKDVGRYYLLWSGLYLKYGEHLAAPRTFNLFNGRKIIIREITGEYPHCIIATYNEDIFLYNRSNIAIVEKEEKNISLKYVLAILNSTFMSYYFLKNTAKSVRKMFPKIILKDLRLFPFKEIDFEEQKSFIKKVDLMLEKNNCYFSIQSQFKDLLSNKFKLEKVSTKLQNWQTLEFNDFIKELKKSKVKLSLSEESEWLSYFNEQKQKGSELKTQIEQTDKEIDQMVYELYGLTPGEIEIVENAI